MKQHADRTKKLYILLVKRILRQFGYPPNLQNNATELVLPQAELMVAAWVSSGG